MSTALADHVATQLESLDACIQMVRDLAGGSLAASGSHGRVLRDVERILQSLRVSGAVVGGLAVIHHGYHRFTRDVDIVLPAEAVREFLRLAPLCGFRVARRDRYGWHALVHKETGMDLHLVPEHAKPRRGAPTRIPGPHDLGVSGIGLGFPTLERLVELKLASGRLRDQADVVELLKEHWGERTGIRKHLSKVHPELAKQFDLLVTQAQREREQEKNR
ncbi:MAG: hypothetical protein HY000_05085 [Planctomycetes bacterium]|nr:hypothetical protein [Planctomycetota bacterium]